MQTAALKLAQSVTFSEPHACEKLGKGLSYLDYTVFRHGSTAPKLPAAIDQALLIWRNRRLVLNEALQILYCSSIQWCTDRTHAAGERFDKHLGEIGFTHA